MLFYQLWHGALFRKKKQIPSSNGYVFPRLFAASIVFHPYFSSRLFRLPTIRIRLRTLCTYLSHIQILLTISYIEQVPWYGLRNTCLHQLQFTAIKIILWDFLTVPVLTRLRCWHIRHYLRIVTLTAQILSISQFL